jgi:hypothetical protein
MKELSKPRKYLSERQSAYRLRIEALPVHKPGYLSRDQLVEWVQDYVRSCVCFTPVMMCKRHADLIATRFRGVE